MQNLTAVPEPIPEATRDQFSKTELPTYVVLFALALAACVAVLPCMLSGYSEGHDFTFHVTAWIDIAQQFRQGTLLPQWSPTMNFGLGSPRFIFYPPLALMLGGVIARILPIQIAIGAYAWLLFLIAGLSMYWFARDLLPRQWALLTAILYMLNPYFTATMYARAAFAEVLAEALFPFLIWSLWRAAQGSSSGVFLASLVMGAIWLCSIPAGFFVAYAAMFLGVLFAWRMRSWSVLIRISTAVFLSAGVIMFYLYPAIKETAFIHVSDVFRDPTENFIFRRTMKDFFIFGLGAAAVIQAFFAGSALLHLRKRQSLSALMEALGVVAVLSVLTMLPISAPFWRVLPGAHYMQFPWRASFLPAFAFAFCTASLLWRASKREIIWGWLAIAIVLGSSAVIAVYHYRVSARMNVASLANGVPVDRLTVLTPRGYFPATARFPKRPPALAELTPVADAAPGGVTIHVSESLATKKSFDIYASAPVWLKVRLFAYPRWHAEIHGAQIPTRIDASGLLEVQAPAGQNRIELVFERSPYLRSGILLSLLSVGLLAGFCLVDRRLRNASFPGLS